MTTTDVIVDERGRPMFRCGVCGEPLTTDDFFSLKMRLPDDGEGAQEYFDAELLDSVEHTNCLEARRNAS